MEYVSIKQISEKWGICARSVGFFEVFRRLPYAVAPTARMVFVRFDAQVVALVQTLCTEGRIEGAQRVGHQWIIPADAPKPKDARVKSGKYIKSKNENGEDIDEQKTI